MNTLLPSFALLAIFAGAAVANRPRAMKGIAFALACSIAGVAMFTNLFATNGVKQTRHDVNHARSVSSAVFEHTPKDAIVISALASKTLWPKRQVLSTAFLVKNDKPVTVSDETTVWSLHPTVPRLADVITRLIRGGQDVYLLNDQTWLQPSDLDQLLERLTAARIDLQVVLFDSVILFRFVAQ